MINGKSKNYKWRIVRVDFTDEKGDKFIYYQLQNKMHFDFTGYTPYGQYYTTLQECEKGLQEAIDYDNRPPINVTYTPVK